MNGIWQISHAAPYITMPAPTHEKRVDHFVRENESITSSRMMNRASGTAERR